MQTSSPAEASNRRGGYGKGGGRGTGNQRPGRKEGPNSYSPTDTGNSALNRPMPEGHSKEIGNLLIVLSKTQEKTIMDGI